MADNAESQESSPLPPKLDLRKGILREGGPKSSTSRIPLEAASPAPGVTQPATPPVPLMPPASEAKTVKKAIAKKETLHIPLDAAAPSPLITTEGGPGRPKTIKIKPVSVPPPAGGSTLGQTAPLQSLTPRVEDLPAEKRKTSRISLEAALAEEPKAVAPEASQTVKPKRPDEAPTVEAIPVPAPAAPQGDSLGKTSRLDLPSPDEGEAETPTRRKTIRIKRPTQKPGVRSVAVKRSADEEEPAEASGATAEPIAEDNPGVMFSIVAIAAIIVICVTLYMQAAQAYPDMNLSWPGKIAAVR